MQILTGFRNAIERFANGSDTDAMQWPGAGLRIGVAWGRGLSLIGVALSVFTVSALAYYHVVVGGERPASGLFQGAVVALYRFLGFVPSFFLALLALVWSSLRFVTGPVKGLMIRSLAILGFCLSLSILVALAQDLAPRAGGVVGSFFGSRLLSLIGSNMASLLLMAVLVIASLLLSTDWFFFRYFQGLLEDAPAARRSLLPAVRGATSGATAPRPVLGPIGEPQPLVKPAGEPRPRGEARVIDLSIRTGSNLDAHPAEATDAESHDRGRRVSLDELPQDLDTEARSAGSATDSGRPAEWDEPGSNETESHGEPPAAEEAREAPPDSPARSDWESDSYSRSSTAPGEPAEVEAEPVPGGTADTPGTDEPRERTAPEPTEPAEEEHPAGEGEGEGEGADAPHQESLFSDRAPAVDQLHEAVELVIKSNRASVAFLQRRLRIRFAEASALLERMEQLGVIGPYHEGSHRAVLLSLEQWRSR